ncbi:hypothetical protein C8R43DRAFT_1007206 [Mycena crocata]|nr:hypothetical protein C8R43DRAFT_1007206 [Mycena crocata]
MEVDGAEFMSEVEGGSADDTDADNTEIDEEEIVEAPTSESQLQRHRDHMESLLPPQGHPGIHQLLSVRPYLKSCGLNQYMPKKFNKILSHPALYLDKRTIAIKNSHFLAFGPTHNYDKASGSWIDSDTLASLCGQRRELFVVLHDAIYYAGIYLCMDLGSIYGEDILLLPNEIDAHQITKLVFAGGPRKQKSRMRLIEESWPKGINVTCIGLQCIGFNQALYDQLQLTRSNNQTSQKRKAEGKVAGSRKKQKK